MNALLNIVIVTRNRSEEIERINSDLSNQSFQYYNVTILDDNSDQSESAKMKRLENDRFKVFSYPPPHKFEGDRKYAYALKKASRKDPKYIFSMHNDMKINDKNLLEKLVKKIDKDENIGAVGPVIYNADGKMTWGPGLKKIRMGKRYLIHESFLVRTSLYKEMNYVHDKLIFYGSEYYIFNWLEMHGYQSELVEDVSITHYGGGTSRVFQNQKDYYRPRTSILIMKLFCKEDTFKRKLRYFYQELSEPRIKIKKFIKNFQFFSLVRTMILLFIGTIAGLVIPIKLNKPYKIEESN